jgi:hypothetical protein
MYSRSDNSSVRTIFTTRFLDKHLGDNVPSYINEWHQTVREEAIKIECYVATSYVFPAIGFSCCMLLRYVLKLRHCYVTFLYFKIYGLFSVNYY